MKTIIDSDYNKNYAEQIQAHEAKIAQIEEESQLKL
jgi:hypothetical protein